MWPRASPAVGLSIAGLGLLLAVAGFAAAFSAVGAVLVLLGSGALLTGFLMVVGVPATFACVVGIAGSAWLIVDLLMDGRDALMATQSRRCSLAFARY